MEILFLASAGLFLLGVLLQLKAKRIGNAFASMMMPLGPPTPRIDEAEARRQVEALRGREAALRETSTLLALLDKAAAKSGPEPKKTWSPPIGAKRQVIFRRTHGHKSKTTTKT